MTDTVKEAASDGGRCARSTAASCGRSRRRRSSARTSCGGARPRRRPWQPQRTTQRSSRSGRHRAGGRGAAREHQGHARVRPARRRGAPVLTDYHVHLRPDEDDSTAERYFTEANVDRYREAAAERGIEELGVAEHIHRFVQSLDVWTHPWYRHWARTTSTNTATSCATRASSSASRRTTCQAARTRRDAARRASLGLRGRPIHFLADEAVDLHGEPDWEEWDVWRSADPDKVWARYFETLGEAARTGMFDILAHPDLVKVWVPVCRSLRATCAASTSARWTASIVRRGCGSVQPPGCASRPVRSTWPGPSSRCASRRPSRGAVERRAPAGAARLRVRARAELSTGWA